MLRSPEGSKLVALKFGSFDFEKLKPENIYNAYLGMTSREQTFALVGAVVLSILIIVLPISVASSRITKLQREVGQGSRQLKDIMHAIEAYEAENAKLDGLLQFLSGGFDSSVSTTLETLAEKEGVKDKIDSLKERASAPSEIFDESSVDVRLKKTSLEQLINYLYAIENQQGKVLRLKKLSMKTRFDKKQDLDVSFTVSTYRLLEGAGEGG
jgi:hypothetical protein